MWGEDTARRSMFSSRRNLYLPNPQQFAPVFNPNCPPAPRSFFHNAFSPVCGVPQQKDSSLLPLQQPLDIDYRSSYPFEKQHIAHRTGDDLTFSSSRNRHARYSSGQYVPQHPDKCSILPSDQFTRGAHAKLENTVDNRFSLKNSPSSNSPFLSERKKFGGIPFISDVTVDNSPSYENITVASSSLAKQEEDSLDCFYNRGTPSEENHESAIAHSFEKGNSLDHSVFSQKSNDSCLSEQGNRCDINVNEDSQSQSSFSAIDSSVDAPTRKPFRFLSEDSHHESGDSVENSFKRQKLGHVSIHTQSELEKHIQEVSDSVVGLEYVTEFQKGNVPPSLYTYRCSLCNSSILAKNVLMHILSVKHRLRYLKTKNESEHQRIMRLHTGQNELAEILAEAVTELESEYGRGSVKVVSDTTFDAKNNEEKKSLEGHFCISPTVSAPSILPPGDSPLLDKIPEPPDLKLLNDILTTAQTLQTGTSTEISQFSSKANEELPKSKSFPFQVETTQSKWPLECEIPPPPPLPYAEGTTSPLNHPLCSLPMSSPSSIAKLQCDVNVITSQSSATLSASANKTETLKRKLPSVDESDIFYTDLPESISKNKNCEGRSPSTLPVPPESFSPKSENSESTKSCSILKNESVPVCESEVLPKIPLINDSSFVSANDDCLKMSKSFDVSDLSKTSPEMKGEPNEEISSICLTGQQVEAGKAAIFEHLSRCAVTTEEEADLVRKIIITLSDLYFAYKLQDLPPDESESLLKALHGGEKEGIKKLASLLYQCPTTGNSLAEKDGYNADTHDEFKRKEDNIDIELHGNGFSSSLNHVKFADENVKSFKSNSDQVFSSPQEEDSKSVPALLVSSHDSDKVLNTRNVALDSTSAMSDNETKLTVSYEGSVNSSDIKSVCVTVKELAIEKCSGDHSTEKDQDCLSDALKFPLMPPPLPPPPEFASVKQPASETVMSEQPSYTEPSESSIQMAIYGGWPMTFYPGASQTSGYMYWPTQSMSGLDPSVMNTQFMAQTQNAEAGLYSWCPQPPPPPPQGSSLPPLPPPPPPPPPPPTSSAP